MSYTITLTGHSSVLSSNFYPPIELKSNCRYGLALLGFYTYNSIFNVDESNNMFAYMEKDGETPTQIRITPGAYEINEIAKVMQRNLKKSCNIEGEDAGCDLLFSLVANNNTLKCELKSSYSIDFRVKNSIGGLLGFGSVLLKSGKRHVSSDNVDIMKVRIVRVDCNIISGAYLNSAQSHTLFEFDIDVEPGYKISKEPQNNIYMPIMPEGRQSIDNITLRILDDNGDLINFRGEKLIIKVELKKIE